MRDAVIDRHGTPVEELRSTNHAFPGIPYPSGTVVTCGDLRRGTHVGGFPVTAGLPAEGTPRPRAHPAFTETAYWC